MAPRPATPLLQGPPPLGHSPLPRPTPSTTAPPPAWVAPGRAVTGTKDGTLDWVTGTRRCPPCLPSPLAAATTLAACWVIVAPWWITCDREASHSRWHVPRLASTAAHSAPAWVWVWVLVLLARRAGRVRPPRPTPPDCPLQAAQPLGALCGAWSFQAAALVGALVGVVPAPHTPLRLRVLLTALWLASTACQGPRSPTWQSLVALQGQSGPSRTGGRRWGCWGTGASSSKPQPGRRTRLGTART